MFDPDKTNKGEMIGAVEMHGTDDDQGFMSKLPPLATMATMAILTQKKLMAGKDVSRDQVQVRPSELQGLVERYLMEVAVEHLHRNGGKSYTPATPLTILTEARDKELLSQIYPDMMKSFATENVN